MKEINEKDRIIAKILRGELSFSNTDIANLESGNLPEEREQELTALADEIKETAENNSKLRKFINENISKTEENPFTKLGLVCIEEDLRNCHEDLDTAEKRHRSNISLGALMTMIFGIAVPMIVSLCTTSLIWSLITLVSGFSLGIGPSLLIERKILKDQRLTKEKIKKLEQERFEILGYEKQNMLEKDVKNSKNMIKHIYASKDLEKEIEDIVLF